MAVTLALVPTLPPDDTSPEYPEDIMAVARVMLAQGITPANLAGCPHLTAAYAAPLAALIAERAARVTRYTEAAKIFRRSGFTSADLRERALIDPEYAYLYLGVAEAMELLEATE